MSEDTTFREVWGQSVGKVFISLLTMVIGLQAWMVVQIMGQNVSMAEIKGFMAASAATDARLVLEDTRLADRLGRLEGRTSDTEKDIIRLKSGAQVVAPKWGWPKPNRQ